MVLPPIIFGTSGLGNLYNATDLAVKQAIVAECLTCADPQVVFDTAGKYGAGLALESIGQCLTNLNADPEQVLISNKLGWLRTELKTAEPTFEPGVWKDLKYDAIQKISYDGILECYEQGNELLGRYPARMLSVHDPDEYLLAATDENDRARRYKDILDAYSALRQLKAAGKIDSIGVGAKDWRTIQRICKDVDLDWVMIANSMTVHQHPQNLLAFMADLHASGVLVINSAIFNAGFLIGSDYYNYNKVSRDTQPELFAWRDKFFMICGRYQVSPAAACTIFALRAPGVTSIALNTTNPERVRVNVALKDTVIPKDFWKELKLQKLIDQNYEI